MSEPDFDSLAKEWVTHLEQEYWENMPCTCKGMLSAMLKRVYREGVKDGYEARKQ